MGDVGGRKKSARVSVFSSSSSDESKEERSTDIERRWERRFADLERNFMEEVLKLKSLLPSSPSGEEEVLTPFLAWNLMKTRRLVATVSKNCIVMAKPDPPFPTLTSRGSGAGARELGRHPSYETFIKKTFFPPSSNLPFRTTVYNDIVAVVVCSACRCSVAGIDSQGRILALGPGQERLRKQDVKIHSCSSPA